MELTFEHTPRHNAFFMIVFWLVRLSLKRLLVGTNDGLTLVRFILALVHIIFVHPDKQRKDRKSAIDRRTGCSQNEYTKCNTIYVLPSTFLFFSNLMLFSCAFQRPTYFDWNRIVCCAYV